MIFCLIGESSSGKSTIESRLEQMGFPRIISYTTRPQRVGEKNGSAYHFIDDETFDMMNDKGMFAETAKYREWNYALSLNGVDYKNKDYVAVVTIHGLLEIVKEVGSDNVVSIYIHVGERERVKRQLKRGDEIDEVFRRVQTDREDFKNAEIICDYTVENNSLDETLVKVYNIIQKHSSAK